MLPFGSQLIGQTEKALNALLRTVLVDRQLSEREWVALRLTSQFDGPDALAETIRDRAQFADAADLLSGLERRGLIVDDALSVAGADLVDEIGREIRALTEPIWAGIDAADAEAAARALRSVLAQTTMLLRG
ncbi:hypothetical protein [Microbacterium sp. TPD7012]|uniref:hypothetical protein n=1 Tax=Microbacterium sp. TPD7012 TaxID=2171975 RepID=UPI000D50802E|nr:hypothetical protein [Microbacterium sp. TPD7012]PVE98218.1 hypothetical protein DC434_01785 [Microbacterium sp. TPD7012]